MGVTGLWKLIDPCGKPVPVETLESKVLAVDISIWLHQVVKGFQDSKGSALPNAHLLGLFHRLCKLLYYRVKPVFVFDGSVPQLKKDTIARRQLQRSKLNTEADRIQALLLESLAKEKVVQQALGTSAAELLLKSPKKKNIRTSRADDTIDDIFKLPELPAASAASKADADNESDLNDSSVDALSDYVTTSATDDSSFDECNSRHYYNANIQAIDVRSKHFKALPADVRHEILVDIKETRKQSSWGRLHELPSKSYDFSTFQMKRLLKRRAVQESIEEAEQEMGGRSLTYSELQNLFTEEGIVEPTAIDVGSKQICSNENTRFLLVRDLKKKLTTLNEDIQKEESNESKIEEQVAFDGKPCCSQETKITVEDSKTIKNNALDNEYTSDLELAIALSLEESNVYSAKDYEYDSDENIKLNKDQRKQLKNAATGPARAFMIEYAGMNEEEVIGIMEKTQNDMEQSLIKDFTNDESCVLKDTEDDIRLNVTTEDDIRLHVSTDSETEIEMGRIKTHAPSTQQKEQNNKVNLTNISDTDSDLEEVPENVENLCNNKTTAQNISSNKCLQVVVDLTKSLVPQDDLFADIFKDGDSIDINSESKNSRKNNEHHLQKELLNSNEDVNSVLEELKKQASEIKNISLDDINIDPSIIELSDDDTSKGDKFMKHEVIEVFDENGKGALKSPDSKTPSKNKPISEYFETNYFIKRTPDKPKDDENVSTVKSPFFINKTPKSSRKRSSVSDSGSPSPGKKMSKVSKSLFSNYENTADENEEKRKSKVTAEDILNEAAIVLKEQKTTDELKELASDIAKEKTDLENERNRQDRMGMSINQRMNSECQELLRLFGIPYIVAPMEAEAQCAFLNTTELTNGTITDDSDIWLFGGRTVYKNFFAQNKHVLEFRANEIEKSFNCDRIKLIQLACLVGSDYTTGINGIGAVTAMEILASFSSKSDQLSASENLTAMSASLATLNRFRDWWAATKSSTLPPCNSTRLALRKKLKNIELHDGFPNVAVINAYLDPKIDENKETFSWGCPDVESIREFAKKKLGWTTSKTDDILMPVMKKLNEKKSQATIKNYFNVKSAISLRQMKVSKRVQNAIDKMSGKIDDVTPEKPERMQKTRSKRMQKTRSKRKIDSTTTTEDEASTQNQHADKSLDAGTSDGLKANVVNQLRKRKIILPETKQIIPQVVKDIEQMRKNKELAIQVLKKTSKTKKLNDK